MINVFIKCINKLISFIDKFERDDTKLIRSYEMSGVEVLTDTGYSPLSSIHLTKSFDVYRLKLENGYALDCADTHIVFNENVQEVFVKDLGVGDMVMTDFGPVRVKSIIKKSYKQCMCDVTVNDNNHRFYSNGILSHNTTTSALFMLHYICFNIDKNALVLGNKRRTSVEILTKLKMLV